jgi:anti-sigma regulatory factor (Ser/Thr protein kinase)
MTVQLTVIPGEPSPGRSLRRSSLAAESILPAGQDPASARSWPLRCYLELRAVPVAVPIARRHVRNILQKWQIRALADTVELLVSEIVTNAVSASASVTGQQDEPGQQAGMLPVRLWLASDRHVVTIRVWDADHHRPRAQDAEPDTETGRGLLLVEALSAQWGCHVVEGQNGKIVWAVCALREGSGSNRDLSAL